MTKKELIELIKFRTYIDICKDFHEREMKGKKDMPAAEHYGAYIVCCDLLYRLNLMINNFNKDNKIFEKKQCRK